MRWLHFRLIVCCRVLARDCRVKRTYTVQDFSAIFQGTRDAPLLITSRPERSPRRLGRASPVADTSPKASTNGVAFNQLVAGPYDKLQIAFDMQFSLYDPPRERGC